MPVKFTDPLCEHLAVRRAAGLFDFSFMSCLEIGGSQAEAYLETLQTRRIDRLSPGRIMYTLICREDGSVYNDATVWCFAGRRYWLFTGRRSDAEHVYAVAENFDVQVTDLSGKLAVIAVQGPRSAQIIGELTKMGPPTMPYFRFQAVKLKQSHDSWLARIGYTGEQGYELIVEVDQAVELWQALVERGRRYGLLECGFDATNGLRIEAGYILFARELCFRVTPQMVGYRRLVDWRKETPFVGAKALSLTWWKEPPGFLVGVVPQRQSTAMLERRMIADHRLVGEEPPPVDRGGVCLTSACYSPIFKGAIGLGFVAYPNRYPGTRVTLEPREFAQVSRLPFFDPPRLLARR